MHLVIYFCGTRCTGSNFIKGYIDKSPSPIRTIFVRSCDQPEVCNDDVFPHLAAFAKRFSTQLFKLRQKKLVLCTNDFDALKIGINTLKSTVMDEDVEEAIDSITLCGYSRGGATCFEVAKQLFDMAPHVPVDIVVNQPIPGNLFNLPGTNAYSIADCSHLTNLHQVGIILGAFTGNSIRDKQETKDYLHLFFSQIVPKFSPKTKREIVVIPKENHQEVHTNSPAGGAHLNMLVVKYLHQKQLTTKKQLQLEESKVRKTYERNPLQPPRLFPPSSTLQIFFGISRSEVYKYTDKFHPRRHLRKGFEWDWKNESLLSWWKKHDKTPKNNCTLLTKKLVETIKYINAKRPEELKILFLETEKWLMLKENSTTTRYSCVEALRNNIYHYLVDELKIPKKELGLLTRKNMLDTHYIYKHWMRESNNASFFKTDATRVLDAAFLKHKKEAKVKGIRANTDLMCALNNWLSIKDNSSKRYHLVTKMRDKLKMMIKLDQHAEMKNVVDEPIRHIFL